MKKDKFMLVLRIVQCLSKHMDISMTTFRKIPYVLQCCEIDLGLKFQLGVNGPYTLELDEFHDFINIEKHGNVKIISVTNDFDISNLSFTDTEKQISNEIYRAYRKFKNIIDAEMFTLLLNRRVDGVHFKSRYDEDRFSGDMSRSNQVLDDFIEGVRPYIGSAKSDF